MSINFSRKRVECEFFDLNIAHLYDITQQLTQKLINVEPKYSVNCTKRTNNLTSREIEVLQCLCRGENNSAISDELCITLATVKAHVSSIMNKLGVSDRVETVYLAKQQKII